MVKYIQKTLSLLWILSLSIVVLNCGKSDNSSESKKNVRKIKITMIAKSSKNPVFLSAKQGAEQAAKALSKKHSKFDVIIDWKTPPNENENAQVDSIRKAVTEGTNAILISCSDGPILTETINQTVADGIPVMTFDSDLPESKRFAFYGANDMEVGATLMDKIAELIGKKGQIAILGGNQDAPNLQNRVAGVRKTSGNYPDIQIVGEYYHAETTEDAAAKVLQVNAENPQLTGWVMVGGWPFFDDKLMDKIEPGKYQIVVVDALPEQLPYLEKEIIQMCLGQPLFKWGEVSVQQIIDYIAFEKEIEPIKNMQLIQVTTANLGGWARQLRAWGFEGLTKHYLTM